MGDSSPVIHSYTADDSTTLMWCVRSLITIVTPAKAGVQAVITAHFKET